MNWQRVTITLIFPELSPSYPPYKRF